MTAATATPTRAPAADTRDKTPGFNFKIPEKIMTPDTVETRIGTLEFVDGVPTDETTQKIEQVDRWRQHPPNLVAIVPVT